MRRTRTERTLTSRLLLALALSAFSLRAAAQPADTSAAPLPASGDGERKAAREHFARGVSLAKKRDYGPALAEFRLAYAASPHFSVLYNIGQALTLLERPSEAISTLEGYLEQGGDRITPARRREVHETLERLRARTGTIELTVVPDGAELWLDDQPLGRSPLAEPLRVDPGSHRIRAALGPGSERELVLDVAAQQVEPAHLELTPPRPPAAPVPLSEAPPVAPPPAPPPAPPLEARRSSPLATAPSLLKQPDHSTRRTIGYLVAGAGLALAGGAVAHYAWNRGRYEDWQAERNAFYLDPTERHREAANGLARSIPAASVVTVALAIGAGVALGTGTLLVLTSAPSPYAATGTGSQGALLRLRGEF